MALLSALDIAADFLDATPLDAPTCVDAPDYHRAFRAWKAVLGDTHVRCDCETNDEYARTTLPNGTRPAGVVRPSTTQEVQKVVSIARRFNVPLHAISRGKNWGYGDACASKDGCVIVELTRMNRIREVNVELGYAVIEPGVSQGQMYEFLRENKIPLLLDVTGAGPDASIVGNILQRGFGHTPYGDRFRHTSGFEVVLSDGRVLNTGFGQFDGAQAASVFPWGVGPWIDGLFTQSNLGIVTSACIWLMPQPNAIEGFALKLTSHDKLGAAVDVVRKLRMQGTVRSTVHIANDLRVLSARTTYPWERCGGRTPLPLEIRSALRAEHGVGVWNVLGGLYGTELEVRAQRRVVSKAFAKVARAHFFRRKTLDRVGRIIPFVPSGHLRDRLRNLLETATSAFDLLEGVPSRAHLKGAFWRTRSHVEANSDVRESGLIWFSPVVPMTGEAVANFLSVAESTLKENGFDPLFTLSTVTDRSLCCVTSINYDKNSAKEGAQAQRCVATLRRQMAELGFYSYRNSSVS